MEEMERLVSLERWFFLITLAIKAIPLIEGLHDPWSVAYMTSFLMTSALLTFLCPFHIVLAWVVHSRFWWGD